MAEKKSLAQKAIDLWEKTGKKLFVDGKEVPDPRPMAIPAGFKKPESLEAKLRRIVRSDRLAEAAKNAGVETFAESQDFDTGEPDAEEYAFDEEEFKEDISNPSQGFQEESVADGRSSGEGEAEAKEGADEGSSAAEGA
jgi:hypothetical protein